MGYLFILFAFVLMNNCLIMEIKRSEKLLGKEILSSKEFQTEEEELRFSGKSKISGQFVNIPFSRRLVEKRKKEIVYNSKIEVTEERTDSFYIIGGIIPFVAQEKGWGTYFKIMAVTFFINIPVALVDWATMPFRTGVSIENKTEKELKDIQVTDKPIQDHSNLKIRINNEMVELRDSELIVPLPVILNNPSVNAKGQFGKYEIKDQEFRYELSGNNVYSKSLPLDKILNETEYLEILKIQAMMKPENFPDIFPYFIGKISSKKIGLGFLDGLLSAGLKLNYKNRDYSALDYACIIENLELVKYLVGKGADINYAGDKNDEFSPLQYAIVSQNLEIVKYLIENGADVNHSGYNKTTPLHTAASKANFEIVEYLVGKGADLNRVDAFDYTPLMRANKSSQIAEYLKSKSSK